MLPGVPLVTLKNTLPVGLIGLASAVSETTAVHVVGCPVTMLLGVQLTLVELERVSTVTCWLPLLAL
jgi:hypothetical protein